MISCKLNKNYQTSERILTSSVITFKERSKRTKSWRHCLKTLNMIHSLEIFANTLSWKERPKLTVFLSMEHPMEARLNSFTDSVRFLRSSTTNRQDQTSTVAIRMENKRRTSSYAKKAVWVSSSIPKTNMSMPSSSLKAKDSWWNRSVVTQERSGEESLWSWPPTSYQRWWENQGNTPTKKSTSIESEYTITKPLWPGVS